jgi:hypothetical protein
MIGMNVAKIDLRSLDGLPASEPSKSFVEIERYDRVTDEEGNIFRLHQEDFAKLWAMATIRNISLTEDQVFLIA